MDSPQRSQQHVETLFVMSSSAGMALRLVEERFQQWRNQNDLRLVSVSHNCVDTGAADEETRFLATILVVAEPWAQ